MSAGAPPKRLWRFEFLRPRGGLSVWYVHHGHGRRLFIITRREARIDFDHLLQIARRRAR